VNTWNPSAADEGTLTMPLTEGQIGAAMDAAAAHLTPLLGTPSGIDPALIEAQRAEVERLLAANITAGHVEVGSAASGEILVILINPDGDAANTDDLGAWLVTNPGLESAIILAVAVTV
jgi:hypothetical protein